MTTYNTQQIAPGGVAPTYNSAASGDKFVPDDRTFLHVKNGDASSHSITVGAIGSISGLTIENLVVAVPAGTEKVIGPFPRGTFADPSDELAHITWSATTSMTWAALRL